MQTTLNQKVIKFLNDHPDQKVTIREIAEYLVDTYPEDFINKRQNPRFKNDEKSFKQQIVREIYRTFYDLLKIEKNIKYQEKPSPRKYWLESKTVNTTITSSDNPTLQSEEITYSEIELYPFLIEFLNNQFNLNCLRINEKRSSNTRGINGNQWLHPDIVAMQALDSQWNELIKTCVKESSGQNVRLWSFEVKKELNSSNVRSSFFQAVSNSSWANEGYLVATAISTSEVEEELRMLSALHGIGVIILIPESPIESEILLPAKRKSQVDWQSINRILDENKDFKNFIELVSIYYRTGRIRIQDWNK